MRSSDKGKSTFRHIVQPESIRHLYTEVKYVSRESLPFRHSLTSSLAFRHDFHPSGRGQGVYDYSDDEEFEDIEVNLFEAVQDQSEIHIVMEDPADTGSSSDEEFEVDANDDSSDSDFLNAESSESEMETADVPPEHKDAESQAGGSGNTRTVEKRVIDSYDPNNEDDEVVKKILTELKKPRLKPPNINTEDFPTDLSFHPDRDFLAVGTVMGDVLIYKYSNEENTLVNTFEVHTKAIRDIEFSIDGRDLFSASRDKSIMITDFETGQLKQFWDKAHDDSIYTITVVDENLIASGDDEGTVRLWDSRIKGTEPVFSLKEVEDYISCIVTNNHKKLLVCTSGDGYMTTLNIAAKKMQVQSEPYEEELTCAGIFRNESKLVAGSSKGNFYTFNWGEFGYHNDAFSCPHSDLLHDSDYRAHCNHRWRRRHHPRDASRAGKDSRRRWTTLAGRRGNGHLQQRRVHRQQLARQRHPVLEHQVL